MLYPYLRTRKLTITRQDVITLFSEEAPFTKHFSEGIRDILEEIRKSTIRPNKKDVVLPFATDPKILKVMVEFKGKDQYWKRPNFKK